MLWFRFYHFSKIVQVGRLICTHRLKWMFIMKIVSRLTDSSLDTKLAKFGVTVNSVSTGKPRRHFNGRSQLEKLNLYLRPYNHSIAVSDWMKFDGEVETVLEPSNQTQRNYWEFISNFIIRNKHESFRDACFEVNQKLYSIFDVGGKKTKVFKVSKALISSSINTSLWWLSRLAKRFVILYRGWISKRKTKITTTKCKPSMDIFLKSK